MVEEREEEGEFVSHQACDYCDSSDAAALYSNGNVHCFSCGVHYNPSLVMEKIDGKWRKINNEVKQEVIENFDTSKIPSELPQITYRDFNARHISKSVASKFSYGVHQGKHCAIYYSSEGEPVAAKYRTRDKKFTWSGSPKKAGLFGMQLFKPNKNLKIVITEGELDALSVAQAQAKLYPVVSLKDGAQSAKKMVEQHWDYLTGFKEAIIMFDMDKAGQKAAKEVAELLPARYARIAKFTDAKDANDLLVQNRADEIVDAIFNAEVYKPENLKSGDDIMDLLLHEENTETFDLLPSTPTLNEKMNGIRMGELTIVTAGSGSGKTTFAKELQHHFFSNSKLNQGIIHLEEPPTKTVLGLVNIDLKKRVHLMQAWKQDKQVIESWKKFAYAKDENGYRRVHIFDGFGSVALEDVYSRIDYLAKVEQCKIIYLDHISMLVSGMEGNIDERRALDNIMTKLASKAVEHNIHIFCISHLNNNTNGKPFEEGNRATVNNLRGSGALKQLAFNIINLTRNQMADNEFERNTIQIDLLKCRETGDTGASDKVYYNHETGCLEALDHSPFSPSNEKDF